MNGYSELDPPLWIYDELDLESPREKVSKTPQAAIDEQAELLSVLSVPHPPVLEKKPLPDTLPKVRTFDPDTLPGAIRDFVLDVSQRQQCPPDFVAVAALCALGGVVGRKASVRPKQHDDWTVYPNLWGALVGPPSAMKSPALKEALKPLAAIEANGKEQYQKELAIHAAETDLQEIEKKSAKDEARKLSRQGKRDAALCCLTVIEPIVEPSRKRIIVNDCTVEKLGELLNENPNGLLLARDELSGWLSKLSQEQYQTDRAFYLECFDGDGHYVYDRIGRGTIDIQSCTLSVIGGIQPSKIIPIVRSATKGTVDDGLIQRLQLAVWPDASTNWTWTDRTPNAAAKDKYTQVFNRLNGLGGDHNFKFEPQAQGLFIEWMTELQRQARAGDMHPALQSHLLKLPKTVAALSLLFALVDQEKKMISAVSIARALDWADYLRSHADRLYSLAVDDGMAGAKLIASRRDNLPQPFVSRDIRRRCWAGLDEQSVVNNALGVLVDYGHIRPQRTTPENGRPVTHFYWVD
jgi:hypothetical protein